MSFNYDLSSIYILMELLSLRMWGKDKQRLSGLQFFLSLIKNKVTT